MFALYVADVQIDVVDTAQEAADRASSLAYYRADYGGGTGPIAWHVVDTSSGATIASGDSNTRDRVVIP